MLYKGMLHENTHPIALYLYINKLFDQGDWIHFDPESLAMAIDKKIAPHSISRKNLNKLLAIKSLLTTDAVYDEWELFLAVFQSLNNLPLSLEIMNITETPLPYLFNTIEIINTIRKQEFGLEVKKFCAAMFLHENVHYTPQPLEFCQAEVAQPIFKCKKCGTTGSALPPFTGICPNCSEMFNLDEKQKPFNFKPLENDLAHADVEITLTYPFIKERDRYLELLPHLDQGITIQENEIDVPVGKLLLAKEYVNNQNKLLKEQIAPLLIKRS